MHIVKILGGLAIAAAGIWLLSKDKSDKELGASEFDGIGCELVSNFVSLTYQNQFN
jgi:hypothetical protein